MLIRNEKSFGGARTLGDSVTDALREAIILGRLPPGTPLRQHELAKDMGVSRIPIREALQQLATERLVENRAHHTAVVAPLSVGELDELYRIVWSLETFAAERGVERLTDEDIAEMDDLYAKMGRKNVSPIEWYFLNVKLHRVFIVRSDLPRVLQITDECRRNIGRYVVDPALFFEKFDDWMKRDLALVEACRARSAARTIAALDVMRILSTPEVREHLQENLEEAPEADKPRPARRRAAAKAR